LIRLGLVGVGAWGRRYLDTVARRQDCLIAAFARGSGRTDFSLPGAEGCASWRQVLERAQAGALAGIIVATTPDSQAEIAAAAISAGVPSLVEKPLGMSRSAAAGVLAVLRAAPRKPPIVVNHVHLWSPAYRALQAAVLASGGADEVTAIEGEGCSRGPLRSWSSLNDYGPHDLAMCLGLMGTEARFVLREARRIPSPDEPGGELFLARFGLGEAEVQLRLGNGAPAKRRRLAVTLRGGRVLTYDDLLPHPHKLLDAGTPVPVSTAMPLDVVLTDFLGQTTSWAAGTFPEATAVASLELCDRVAMMVDAIAGAAGSA
jgi:predicted dehydrogenase